MQARIFLKLEKTKVTQQSVAYVLEKGFISHSVVLPAMIFMRLRTYSEIED